MKEIENNIKLDDYSDYIVLDWKDFSNEALDQIDEALKEFNLELEVMNDSGDSFVFRIIKR